MKIVIGALLANIIKYRVRTVSNVPTIRMDIRNLPMLGKPKNIRENPAFKKIDTPEFRSIFTPELEALVNVFKKYNYELRIAGGAVRDILMNIRPKDIDFATTATPDEMKKMFTKEEIRMINSKGEKHGTITSRINNKENFEVTTLRIDIRTDGRHADVQFTTDWELDACRRDLTINSMYLGFDGTIYDYFYGYDDLQERRVVFVGDANSRIKEDYLRILRYYRFYGRIADSINKHDPNIIEAIRANSNGLANISGERIWNELQKILVGNFGTALMLNMHDCNLFQYFGLPEQPNLLEFKRLCNDLLKFPKPHYPILWIISLLNNMEDVLNLHKRLKLSAFERDMALFIVEQRDRLDFAKLTLHDCQKLCLDQTINRNFKTFVEELLKYKNKLDLYTELKAWQIPQFPVNSHTILAHGCPEGIALGLVRKQLIKIWAESKFQLTEEELLKQHLPRILADFKMPPNKKRRSS